MSYRPFCRLSSLLKTAGHASIAWTCHDLFNQSPTGGYSGCLQFSAAASRVAMHILLCASLWALQLFLLERNGKVELLGVHICLKAAFMRSNRLPIPLWILDIAWNLCEGIWQKDRNSLGFSKTRWLPRIGENRRGSSLSFHLVTVCQHLNPTGCWC